MASIHYKVTLECGHILTYYYEFAIAEEMTDEDKLFCKYCKEDKEVESVRDYIEVFD